MNKLIIVESGDRLGKGSLIKGLCEYYDYKNITLRHCDKPPKNLSSKETLSFQFECFKQEFDLITYIGQLNDKLCYHDNIIIYDRFYLGEYVYGYLFRNNDSKEIKDKINILERYYLDPNKIKVYLITLTADPEFFLSREDGQSFSKNLEQKTKELELFKEVHELSLIKNKLLVKVDETAETPTGSGWIMQLPNIFRPKEDILNEVINFIK